MRVDEHGWPIGTPFVVAAAASRALTNFPSRRPAQAGILSAWVGSCLVMLVTAFFAVPLGVAAGLYLEEYAHKERWYNRLLELNIQNLAGVPSILYGLLGLGLFVRALGMGRSSVSELREVGEMLAFLRQPDAAYRIWAQYNRALLRFARVHREQVAIVSTDGLLAAPQRAAAAAAAAAPGHGEHQREEPVAGEIAVGGERRLRDLLRR